MEAPLPNSAFHQFYAWQCQQSHGAAGGFPGSRPFFPCSLPFPCKGVTEAALTKEEQWVNMLFSLYSFVELGYPKSESRYEPAGGFRLDSKTTLQFNTTEWLSC